MARHPSICFIRIALRWLSLAITARPRRGAIPALVGVAVVFALIAIPDVRPRSIPKDSPLDSSRDSTSSIRTAPNPAFRPPNLSPANPANGSARVVDVAFGRGSRVDPSSTRTDRIVVRFLDGHGQGDEAFRGLLEKYPGTTLRPHFQQSSDAIEIARKSGEARSGRTLPDLNRYVRVQLSPGMREEHANRFLQELIALECVAIAFAEPLAEPAAHEHDTGAGSEGAGESRDETPDFRPLQLYLQEAPIGLGVTLCSSYPGARGRGVRLVDIEAGWNWAHEDLPEPFFSLGPTLEAWQDHGTAVLGELVGKTNGRGVEGIVPDLEVGTVSFSEIGVAAAIDLASSVLDEGDIILIELHAPGPNAPHGGGQFGFLPMEYWQDVFDAIQIAAANGRIVVEAAGNGQQDLDSPMYRGLFDRNVRDSGAVLVAAGTPLGLEAERFTNHGSRIDLHGWGTSITTTGYGTLHGDDRNRWYTTGFGGTSGASPMICGAIASLQGMCLAAYGVSLDRDLAVELLTSTGSRANGTKQIGPRPNLVEARARLMQGVGLIHGAARDAVTARPLANLRLVVDGTRTIWTDAQGHYEAPILPGSHTLSAAGFWYEESFHAFETQAHHPLLQNLRLRPRALGQLNAFVTHDSRPVVVAPVMILNSPIFGYTDPCGELAMAAPHGSYVASAGPLPGTGAAWSMVTSSETSQRVVLQLPPAETFEGTDGGFTSDSGWMLGTPVSGPSPHSGARVWATSLEGEYDNRVKATLTSPMLALRAAEKIHLSFSHWYRMESAWDGGQVQVWNGSQWLTATPIGGYPMDALSALEWDSGYSGASNGWEVARFDLSAEANDEFQVRFVFGSDESISDLGWYLDDIAIASELDRATSASEPGDDRDEFLLSLSLEPAFPNPFSGSTRLRYSLPATERVGLTIHDAGGRLVRRLVDAVRDPGVHEQTWDGTDDTGRASPAGVYYGRLTVSGTTLVRSLLRVY